MARNFYINGESLVQANGQDVGLSDGAINVSIEVKHHDIIVDAWGDVPPEKQFMLAQADFSITFVHFDAAYIGTLFAKSCGGGAGEGVMGRAGTRMNANSFSLSITSPVAGAPWVFPNTVISGPGNEWPLGTKKSLLRVHFSAWPAANDPYNGGTGAQGAVLYSR